MGRMWLFDWLIDYGWMDGWVDCLLKEMRGREAHAQIEMRGRRIQIQMPRDCAVFPSPWSQWIEVSNRFSVAYYCMKGLKMFFWSHSKMHVSLKQLKTSDWKTANRLLLQHPHRFATLRCRLYTPITGGKCLESYHTHPNSTASRQRRASNIATRKHPC